MKAFSAMVILCMFFSSIAAQQRVGIGTTSPNASAILDVQSTTQGILVPRMTSAQRTTIANPANGLLVFDVTTSSFWYRSAGVWTELVDASSNHIQENGNNLYLGMNGNVGIGTTNPITKLQIQTVGTSAGLSHTNGTVTLGTHTSNTIGSFGTISNHPLHLMANNGSNHLTISTIGNLGLGNQAPVHPLSFAQQTGPKINLFGDASSYFGLNVAPNQLQIHSNTPTSNIAFGYGSHAAFFEKMRITASGLVGIGTPNPAQQLHVEGNTYVRDSIGIGVSQPFVPLSFANTIGEKISLYGNSAANFGFGISNGNLMIHSNQSNADIVFGYGSTPNMNEKIRMTGSGRLGIGTNNPSEPLSVGEKFRVKSSGSIQYHNDVPILMYLYEGSSGSNGDKMIFSHSPQFPTFGVQYGTNNRIDFLGGESNIAMAVDLGSKRVGIGHGSPAEKLDVLGNVKVSGTINSGGITSTGNLNVTGDIVVSEDIHVGYEVEEVEIVLPPFATQDVDCSCPPGKTVTGGGWDAIAGVVAVTMSRPIQNTIWRIRASNPSAAPNPIRVFAVCARIKS